MTGIAFPGIAIGGIAQSGIARAGISGAGLGFIGGRGVTPQVAQWLGRLTPGETAAFKIAAAGVINGIWAAGLNQKLDTFYIRRPGVAANALVNLMSSSFLSVLHGAPTFTANVGYTGINDSNAYIDTTFNPITAVSPKFAQNSHVFGGGIVAGTKAALDQTLMGNGNSYYIPYFSDGNLYARASMASDLTGTPAASLVGHHAVIRTAVNAAIVRKDGANIATTAVASAAPSNAPFLVLQDGLADRSSLTVSYDYIGGNGFTAGDADTLAALMTAFFP